MTGPEREPLTVLFVDGDRTVRDAVALYASLQQDLLVRTAASGAELFRQLQQGFVPDALVADTLLPDITVFELLSGLDRLCLKRPPAVVLTLRVADDAMCARLLTAGADFFMLKPYRLPAMFDAAAMVSANGQTVLRRRAASHVNWYLAQMCAPPEVEGTTYLRRIVTRLVLQDPTATADELYREVARQERATPNTISKAVGRAVRILWQQAAPQYRQLCAQLGESLDRPLANGKLIKALAERIRWELHL